MAPDGVAVFGALQGDTARGLDIGIKAKRQDADSAARRGKGRHRTLE